MEIKRIRPYVSLEQLVLERIELEWMLINNPPIARTQVVRRRGGRLLVLEEGHVENAIFRMVQPGNSYGHG